jgi:hypothetical protein
MLFLDAFGGWESQQIMKEKRVIKSPQGRFTYIWDQVAFNPIDNNVRCHIHFGFAKGKRMRKAFTYNWRLYSPVEVCDALEEAGFVNSQVYWDRSPSPSRSDYRRAKKAENTPGWLVYIVAEAGEK